MRAIAATFQGGIGLECSSEQNAGRLRVEIPNPKMRLSADIVYKAIYLQRRGLLKRECDAH